MGDFEREMTEVVGTEVPGNDGGVSVVEKADVGVAKMVMRCSSLLLVPSYLPSLS